MPVSIRAMTGCLTPLSSSSFFWLMPFSCRALKLQNRTESGIARERQPKVGQLIDLGAPFRAEQCIQNFSACGVGNFNLEVRRSVGTKAPYGLNGFRTQDGVKVERSFTTPFSDICILNESSECGGGGGRRTDECRSAAGDAAELTQDVGTDVSAKRADKKRLVALERTMGEPSERWVVR